MLLGRPGRTREEEGIGARHQERKDRGSNGRCQQQPGSSLMRPHLLSWVCAELVAGQLDGVCDSFIHALGTQHLADEPLPTYEHLGLPPSRRRCAAHDPRVRWTRTAALTPHIDLLYWNLQAVMALEESIAVQQAVQVVSPDLVPYVTRVQVLVEMGQFERAVGYGREAERVVASMESAAVEQQVSTLPILNAMLASAFEGLGRIRECMQYHERAYESMWPCQRLRRVVAPEMQTLSIVQRGFCLGRARRRRRSTSLFKWH